MSSLHLLGASFSPITEQVFIQNLLCGRQFFLHFYSNIFNVFKKDSIWFLYYM